MKPTLRLKLVVSFLSVIVITGVFATIIGFYIINKDVVREAQSKVTLDLNSARQIYDQRLRDIEKALIFTAMRKFGVKRALQEGDFGLMLESLCNARKEAVMDILVITDKEGRVIVRAHNPGVFGDSMAGDEFVQRVIMHKNSISGTAILSRMELLKESEALADRARIKLFSTPRGQEKREHENMSGMMLKAAVPLLNDTGELVGVLYGGVLLNRNFDIVDKIKDIVYKNIKYKGKEVGTATIFQDGFRISTNVTIRSGERAIGTIVSKEVYERVIEQGRIWTDRAFVVNDWYLTAYSPIKSIQGKIIGMLYVGMLENKYDDMKRNSLWMFFIVIITGIVLALAVSCILAHIIVKPIRQLKLGVEALAEGNFDFNVTVRSHDEIGCLEESFNKVRLELKQTYNRLKGKIEAADEDLKKAYTELSEKQELLVQKEHLASIGQLSAGVAHEINNPIGTILLYSHTLLKQFPKNDSHREDLGMVVKEANRCKEIVRNLLNFARQSNVSKEPTDLAGLVDEVFSLVKAEDEAGDICLTSQVQDDLPVIMVDRTQIQQVLVNLIRNSIDAVSEAGEIKVSVFLSQDPTSVEITVTDNGCGIKRENVSKLFTPFFTTKEMGKGTGLGLAIAYGIVKMHSGTITVESCPDKGTTFSITLPLHIDNNQNDACSESHYTDCQTGKENRYV